MRGSPGPDLFIDAVPARHSTLLAVVLAAVVVALSFAWQSHAGFSLWDEGFLWYGAQRVVAGEVPIRDYMAYDPGRYYAAAAVMSLSSDDGIVTLRVALALVQWIGVAVGLVVLARAAPRAGALPLLLAAVVLVMWMFPRHKMFDATTSLVLVGTLAHLAAAPKPARYALAGLVVGLVAVIGRNHGVYGVVGTLLLAGYLRLRGESGAPLWQCALAFAAGVVVGYLPVIAMIVAVPGFLDAFAESVRFLFAIEGTNLLLPTPWPWRVAWAGSAGIEVVRQLLLGSLFIVLLAWIVVGAAWLAGRARRAQRPHPALMASIALSVPYAHYAFSRADVGHLALGILPVLVGALFLLLRSPPLAASALGSVLMAVSAIVALPNQPGGLCLRPGDCVATDVAGDRLRIDPATASDVALLERLADTYAPAGRSMLVVPYWPGAYALLHRRAPQWEIYALFHRDEAFEAREIERIAAAAPGFVLVFDYALDHREALRYANTHPAIDRYVREHFRPLQGQSTNPAYRIYAAERNLP